MLLAGFPRSNSHAAKHRTWRWNLSSPGLYRHARTESRIPSGLALQGVRRPHRVANAWSSPRAIGLPNWKFPRFGSRRGLYRAEEARRASRYLRSRDGRRGQMPEGGTPCCVYPRAQWKATLSLSRWFWRRRWRSTTIPQAGPGDAAASGRGHEATRVPVRVGGDAGRAARRRGAAGREGVADRVLTLSLPFSTPTFRPSGRDFATKAMWKARTSPWNSVSPMAGPKARRHGRRTGSAEGRRDRHRKRSAAREARNATGTIPIVTAVHGDPVGAGLAASLTRPGGNVTGLSLLPRTERQTATAAQGGPSEGHSRGHHLERQQCRGRSLPRRESFRGSLARAGTFSLSRCAPRRISMRAFEAIVARSARAPS